MTLPNQREPRAPLGPTARRSRRNITGATLALGLLCGLLLGCSNQNEPPATPTQPLQTFQVKGSIKSIPQDRQAAIIQHETIPGYMDAMIMPFQVKDSNVLAGLVAGDEISFRLSVTEEDSWIDDISRIGHTEPKAPEPMADGNEEQFVPPARHPLKDFGFTNELNQVTRLSDFVGSAVAITFIFTRCPIPNYCPRLSKNFETACQILKSTPGAPTNWHFLSFTIDPDYDTPAVLKAYGERYNYDPTRWSFLTGPKEQLEALAQQSGMTSGWEAGQLNHNFRTLIIDATGNLQTAFPTSGDLSASIVSEILKAAKATPETRL